MEIRKQTIDKYVRWLALVKKQEGRTLDFDEAAVQLNCPKNLQYYARKANLIDFRMDKILRVNFKEPEPIHARRLADAIYATKNPVVKDLPVEKRAHVEKEPSKFKGVLKEAKKRQEVEVAADNLTGKPFERHNTVFTQEVAPVAIHQDNSTDHIVPEKYIKVEKEHPVKWVATNKCVYKVFGIPVFSIEK